MSLIRAERRRLFQRRAVRLMLALALLVLASLPVIFTVVSRPNDASARAAAEQEAKAAYERDMSYHQQFVTQCKADKAANVPGSEQHPEDCYENSGPRQEYYEAEQYLPYNFNFAEEFRYLVMAFAAVMMVAAFIIGATFVGAEWNSGGMMNLLLWRPRRIPTLLTKLGVLLGGMLGVTVVFGAAFTAAFWAIGTYDGTMGLISADVWRSLGLDGVRAAALILAVSAIGFALASLGRHTAMALGVAMGVGLVSEVGVLIVASVTGYPIYQRYQLSTYVIAWLHQKISFYDFATCDYSMGECNPTEVVFTWQDSAWLFGIVVTVLIGGALWMIRRRDVT